MKLVRITIFLQLFLFIAVMSSQAQNQTREQYIKKYKNLVLEHQDIYGIPASIKMAQGLLESDNGNSRLATIANNHFGIKCKKEWTGETLSHDDDAPGECFRKYNSAEESFKDHSEFLDKSPRYQELFKLDPLDYKGWAYGLKAAGYATNPKYPELLIKIIDDNRLYLLDQGKELPTKEIGAAETPEIRNEVIAEADKIDIDNYVVSVHNFKGYAIYSNNGSQFVVACKGDTFESIAKTFNISAKRLLKYNDLQQGAVLHNGEMVYIKAKGRRTTNGKLMHYVKEGETMHSISQKYGIRLRSLGKTNRRATDSVLIKGQQIRLM